MIVKPRSGKNVLVVEDDPLIRGAMKMVLEWEGYRVRCAGDGREGLHLLRAGEPTSLILLDAEMPVLDGWGFRQEQKQDPSLADIPVVVVTGADRSGSPDAEAHVQKPFQA